MKINLRKIISYVVLLFPPLSTYLIIGSSFTLGDLTLCIFFFIMIFDMIKRRKKISIVYPLIIYAFAIIMLTTLQWILGLSDIRIDLMSVFRYVTYILFVAFASKNYFNVEQYSSIYMRISVFFAIYTIAQWTSFYIFHRILPINVLSMLGIRANESAYISDNLSRYSGMMILYRPSGFFVEPAHYVVYQAPILYLLVNNKIKVEKYRLVYCTIVSLSILLSGSTTGLIILAFCYSFRLINYAKKDIVKTVFLTVCASAVCITFLKTTYGNMILTRSISNDSNNAINGRFQNINTIFDGNYNLIIGNGFKNGQSEYLPSFQYLIKSYGIAGLLVFIYVIISSYIKSNKLGRNILILFLLTMIGTLSLFGINVILYFSLIYSNYLIKKRSKSDVDR